MEASDLPLSVNDLTISPSENREEEIAKEAEVKNGLINTKNDQSSQGKLKKGNTKVVAEQAKNKNIAFIEDVKECFQIERESLLEEIRRLQKRLNNLTISCSCRQSTSLNEIGIYKPKLYQSCILSRATPDVHRENVAKAQIAKLRKDLNTYWHKAETQKSRADASAQALADMTFQFKKCKADNHNLKLSAQKEVEKYEDMLRKQKDQTREITRRNSIQYEELNRMLKVIEDENKNLEFERDTWKQKGIEAESKQSDLLKDLQESSRKWEKKNYEYNLQLERIKSKLKEEQRHCLYLKANIEDKNACIKEGQMKSEGLEKALKDLQMQLENMKRLNENEKTEKREIMEKLKRTSAEFNKQIQETEVFRLRCSAMERERERFSDNLSRLEQTNKEIRGSTESDMMEIEKLRTQLEMSEKKLSASLEEVVHLEKDISTLTIRMKKAEDMYLSTNDKLLKSAAHNSVLQATIKNHQEKNESMQAEVKTCNMQVAQLRESERLAQVEARASRDSSQINQEKANSALEEAFTQSSLAKKLKISLSASTESQRKIQDQLKESNERNHLASEDILSYQHAMFMDSESKKLELTEMQAKIDQLIIFKCKVEDLEKLNEELSNKNRIANTRCVRLHEKILGRECVLVDERMRDTAAEIEEDKDQTIANLKNLVQEKLALVNAKERSLSVMKADHAILANKVREQALTIHQLTLTAES